MIALRKILRAICAVCHSRELADALKANRIAIERLNHRLHHHHG